MGDGPLAKKSTWPDHGGELELVLRQQKRAWRGGIWVEKTFLSRERSEGKRGAKGLLEPLRGSGSCWSWSLAGLCRNSSRKAVGHNTVRISGQVQMWNLSD